MQNMVRETERSAKEMGVSFQVFDAGTPNDFGVAFDTMVKAQVDTLLIFPSPMFYVNYRRLVDLAAIHRLPTMYAFREAVQAGGLLSYGADIPDLDRTAAKYIAKILKGAKPSDLPVEQPTRFELVINLKTARALGIDVAPQMQQLADEVIE
jgi:putative tryptophan/tyrosine transport system substrate-binding protein